MFEIKLLAGIHAIYASVITNRHNTGSCIMYNKCSQYIFRNLVYLVFEQSKHKFIFHLVRIHWNHFTMNFLPHNDEIYPYIIYYILGTYKLSLSYLFPIVERSIVRPY